MKLIIPILSILALTSFYLFQTRQNVISETEDDILQTRSKIQNLKKQQNEIKANPVNRPDENQFQDLREQRKHLIKLRGDHTRLSTTKDWSLTDLENEIEKVENRAITVKNEGKLIKEMDEAHKHDKRVRQHLQSFFYAIKFLHEKNLNPHSMQEVKELIDGLPDSLDQKKWFSQSFEIVDQWHPIRWQDCELVVLDSPGSDNTQKRFYITERKPRVFPDGTLSRVYISNGKKSSHLLQGLPQEFHQQESELLENLPDSLF